MTATDALRHYFGYDTFRPMQAEVIDTIVSGRDALVLMPTGGGKSMCFQIPALMRPGMCVVVSPLIALMQDQVAGLKANGIAAAYLNSSQDFKTYCEVLDQVKISEIKLLYISPEKLLTQETLQLLSEVKINLFAIDEAHCISSWGHDFRPEYTQLVRIKRWFPNVPIVALTATADKNTRQDIQTQLGLEEPAIFISSFDRPNLSLTVKPGKEKMAKILDFIKLRPRQAGIVYCLSRKSTESVAAKLEAQGLSAKAYHAGMSPSARRQVQHDFINDKVDIVCATIAFGMGIDKSNVRWVIHYNLPKNLESYYQEIGRAGRDGLPSDTLLLYSAGDVIQIRKFIEEGGRSQVQLAKLERMEQYAMAQSCRRQVLLNYFSEQTEGNCQNCDVCLNPPERFDGTVLAQKALSALVRLREQVGLQMLIDVLRGSQKKELLNRNFHLIKTYGKGSDLSNRDWQHILLQLLDQGLVEVAYDQHKTLKMTAIGYDVLKGDQPISLTRPEKVVAKKQTKRVAVDSTPQSYDEGLFEHLRKLRRSIAQAQHVPPYVVFSDYTLKEMVRYRPQDEMSMRAISGVGAKKWERYGEQFIQAIETYGVRR